MAMYRRRHLRIGKKWWSPQSHPRLRIMTLNWRWSLYKRVREVKSQTRTLFDFGYLLCSLESRFHAVAPESGCSFRRMFLESTSGQGRSTSSIPPSRHGELASQRKPELTVEARPATLTGIHNKCYTIYQHSDKEAGDEHTGSVIFHFGR